MIDTPQIVQTTLQLTAIIPLTVPRADIQKVMGPGISELMTAVGAQRIAITGPWFTHHLSRPTDVFDFEISVPVAAPVAPVGRVRPGQLPATRVARTTYSGPYEGLGAGWGELRAWIAAEGHTPGPDMWERYITGPETSGDPATWRTELNQPLTDD